MKTTETTLDFMFIIGMVIAFSGLFFLGCILYQLLTCVGLSIAIASKVIGLKKKIINERKDMVLSSVVMIIFAVGIIFCIMGFIKSTHIAIGIAILFFLAIILLALIVMVLSMIGYPRKVAKFIRDTNYNILEKLRML